MSFLVCKLHTTLIQNKTVALTHTIICYNYFDSFKVYSNTV